MVLWRKNLKMVSVETILNEQHELANFAELCRLCGNLKESVVPMYDEAQSCNSYHNVINTHISDIQVSKTDPLPLKLCVDCLTTVISWHEFYNNCLQVNEKLRAVVDKFNIVKPLDSELGQKVTNDIEVIEVNVDSEHFDDYYNDTGDYKEPMLLDEAVDNLAVFTTNEVTTNIPTGQQNTADRLPEEHIQIIVEEQCITTWSDTTLENNDNNTYDISNITTTGSDQSSNDDKSQADQFLVDVSELKSVPESNCDDTAIHVDLGGLNYSQLEGFVLNDNTSRYHCASCFKGYNTKEELLKHIGSQHSLGVCRSELYECDMCTRLFGDNERRNRHRADTHKIEVPLAKDYKVVRNNETTCAGTVAEELIEGGESYRCTLCNQNFAQLGKLKVHNMRKHGVVYENARRCSICSLIMLNKRSLAWHLKTVHSNATSRGSNDAFTTMTEEYIEFLSKRIAYEGQMRYFQCDKCSYRCQTIHKFVRHGRKHELINPTCDHCGKSFNEKGKLGRHIRHVHLRIKTIPCPVCCKMFGEKRHMVEHMNLHREVCSYVCEVCGKQFKQRQSMAVHKQMHRGKKTFKCEYCDKAFTFRSKMLNHMKQHTGKNLSVCDICNKSFTSSTHLRVHKSKHSTVRPFQCDVCEKKLKTSRSLKQHMISFHKEKTSKPDKSVKR